MNNLYSECDLFCNEITVQKASFKILLEKEGASFYEIFMRENVKKDEHL